MPGSFCGVIALVAAAGLSVTVSAQVGTGQATTGASERAVQKWVPYTAEYKQIWVRKWADGNTTTSVMIEVNARDSRGLWVRSTTAILPSGGLAPTTSFDVADPETRIHSEWNVVRPGENATVARSATVTQPADSTAVYACVSRALAIGPTTTTKPMSGSPGHAMGDLGTKTILGLEVRGYRYSTTIPAGLDGSAQSFVRIGEDWTYIIPGLVLLISQVTDDPQVHYTHELVSLTLDEPDPALFQPPAEYGVVNKGSTWTCPTPSVNDANPKAEDDTPEQ